MRKFVFILWLSTFAILLINCSRDKYNTFATTADYNLITHTLQVDYLDVPEKSLQDIITLSKIRKSGYGLLLNVNNYYSQSELDTLKRQFQKLDINAIHSFQIAVKDSLQTKLEVGMEGAQFIWILNDNLDWQKQNLGRLIAKLQSSKDSSALIVINKN